MGEEFIKGLYICFHVVTRARHVLLLLDHLIHETVALRLAHGELGGLRSVNKTLLVVAIPDAVMVGYGTWPVVFDIGRDPHSLVPVEVCPRASVILHLLENLSLVRIRSRKSFIIFQLAI